MAVLEKNTMLSLAENAVKAALTKGAAEVEAYVYEGQTTSVGIERGQVTKSSRIIDRGLGVRVSVERAMGFAYANVVSSSDVVEKTVANALSAARASNPDPDWHGLPEKRSCTVAEKTFDRKIAEIRPEDLVNVATVMLDSALRTDNRVFPVEGGAGAGYVATALASSNGIASFDKGTLIDCSLAAVAREGSRVTPVCFEFNAERSFNVNADWVGAEAGRLAVSALNTRHIETKTTTLILTQFALQDLLYYTLINAAKADNVQRGQSAFKDKIGAQVASEEVTIHDDGLFPGGLRTAAFDGEGTPHQKTLLVEKGVLRNFLYDNYAAKKEGRESTGNASRTGYFSTPSIEATNFHLKPGRTTEEELISEVDDGLIIYNLQGAHSSNPVSGEFSVVATPAWKIKKGAIVHCSRGVMLAGNIFEALKNISRIAKNERKMGQLIAPWVLMENVKVIGR